MLIYLGDYQRNVSVASEIRRVVNHDTPRCCRLWRKLGRDCAARRKKPNLNLTEIEGRKVLDYN